MNRRRPGRSLHHQVSLCRCPGVFSTRLHGRERERARQSGSRRCLTRSDDRLRSTERRWRTTLRRHRPDAERQGKGFRARGVPRAELKEVVDQSESVEPKLVDAGAGLALINQNIWKGIQQSTLARCEAMGNPIAILDTPKDKIEPQDVFDCGVETFTSMRDRARPSSAP